MRDDPVVIALVDRAAAGDEGAWNEIVDRYAPLVWSICTRYQLGHEEAHDVGQTVWLLLVEKIGGLREPAALPGWLATTTQRECFRVLRVERRHEHTELPPEDQMPPDPDATMIEEEVLAAERGAAFRAAFDDASEWLPGAAVAARQRSSARLRGDQRDAGGARWAASARCGPAASTGCAALRR